MQEPPGAGVCPPARLPRAGTRCGLVAAFQCDAPVHKQSQMARGETHLLEMKRPPASLQRTPGPVKRTPAPAKRHPAPLQHALRPVQQPRGSLHVAPAPVKHAPDADVVAPAPAQRAPGPSLVALAAAGRLLAPLRVSPAPVDLHRSVFVVALAPAEIATEARREATRPAERRSSPRALAPAAAELREGARAVAATAEQASPPTTWRREEIYDDKGANPRVAIPRVNAASGRVCSSQRVTGWFSATTVICWASSRPPESRMSTSTSSPRSRFSGS